MQQSIDMGLLSHYFNEEVSAKSFLDNLHEVIVEHVRLAGNFQGYADLETVATNVDFLGHLYDAVRAATKEE